MFRTRLFQWITERYPTEALHHSRCKRALYRLLLALVAPPGRITLRTAGYRIHFCRAVPDIARQIAIERAWEPTATRVFASLLRPGMRVYDVGANIGHYTLVAAAAVGPKGHVAAFEPMPAHRRDLAANVAGNGLGNVSVHRLALGERNGVRELYADPRNPGGHSFSRQNAGAVAGPLRVETATLDAVAARLGGDPPVHLIKMDTQGAEGAILRGGRRTLRRHRPLLVLEFWPFGLRNCGDSGRALLEELAALGYRWQEIHEGSGELRGTTAGSLLAAYPETVDYGFTNLLARAAPD